MKKLNYVFFSLFLVTLLMTGCERDSEPGSTTPPASAGFTWRENSTTAPLKTAGSSEVRTQYTSIFAFTGATATSGTLFEFNLSGLAPATYPVNATNAFYFNGNTATPATGEVVITANANGKASGTFKATWTSGTVTSVYGTFTDIPVK